MLVALNVEPLKSLCTSLRAMHAGAILVRSLTAMPSQGFASLHQASPDQRMAELSHPMRTRNSRPGLSKVRYTSRTGTVRRASTFWSSSA